MRTFFSAMAVLLLTACAAETTEENVKADTSAEDVVSQPEKQNVDAQKQRLDGFLDEEALRAQFQELKANGIESETKYKWEFRFQGKIMSSLEDFAQLAHIYDFWPVVLESSVDGSMYWLYIQKTDSYNEEKFVKEGSDLFKMAEMRNLTRFDGFSVDYADDKV